MTQKGIHTWDLTIHYHRCPKCGCIIENRDDYHYQMGSWIKDVICDRCEYQFTLMKERKPTLGPFTGIPQPREIDWDYR